MVAASSGLKQLHLKPVHHLYVTLRRSFAGTPKKYEAILKSLGFSYRQQTLCLPNSLSTRGQISKVSSQPAWSCIAEQFLCIPVCWFYPRR